jgi:ubiquinone/menaquinone biosynthesis C-methylase UbiE
MTMAESQSNFSDGAGYERFMGRWSRLAGQQFLAWLDVPKGKSWLDVGCGNGAFTEEIYNYAAPSAVIGIDPSEGQLAFARTRPGTPGANYQLGDAAPLPFGDASFDIADMALVIAFVPDPAKAVAEMVRVTKPGGIVASYMWDLPAGGVPLSPMMRAMKEVGSPTAQPPNAAFSSMDALRKLWIDAGLKSVETSVIRITVSFNDFEDFWQTNTLPLGPQAKIIQDMSAETKEKLRAQLQKTLPTSPDGRIAFESFANAVKGIV